MNRVPAVAALAVVVGCANPYVHHRKVPPGHGDAVYPVKVVTPEYPAGPRLDGIEGSVTLEFDVTKAGTVENLSVIESDPPGVFDEAATRAVLQYEYEPRVENGVPVRTTGVRTTVRFAIELRR